MRWFEKIVDRMSWFAVPRLALFLVAGSATFFILGLSHPELLSSLPLIPDNVLKGEVWRLVTFLFYPLDMNPIFAFFTYYLFYIMGSSLEEEWGDAKFTLYVFIAYLSTAALAFLNPFGSASNEFIFGSIFLAFAFLYPDFTLYLFFIIPVKVKYIAAVTWVVYGWLLVTGDWGIRIAILASVGNFLLFFGGAILNHVRAGKHQMESKAREIHDDKIPFHSCGTCKTTEKTDPKADFRVCLQCKGGIEYCLQHLKDHEHKVSS